MKLYGKIFFAASLLTLLVSCGKENKSGQSNFSYNTNPYCAGYNCSYQNYSSIPAYNSGFINAMVAQQANPCAAGTYFTQQKILVTSQVSLNTIVTAGDVFMGVTSYGDLAYIQGNGSRVATLTAYICPRSMMSGQGQVTLPTLGAYTNCGVKPITAMNMVFPDGYVAKFRDPGLGIYNLQTGQRIGSFPFCQN